MRTRSPVRGTLLAGAGALAVVLAGCAEGDPDAAAPEPDAPESSETEAEELDQEDAVGDEDAVEDEDTVESATPQDDADGAAQGDEHDDGHDDTDAADAAPTEVDGKPVIEIDMLEFAYAPESIEIEAGEPTILRFTNRGAVEHEAMIGDSHMQEEFAASDDHGNHGDDGGDGHHGDTMAVTVAAGETADLEVVVDEPGTWYVGCHLPGHYDAGMEAPLTISG